MQFKRLLIIIYLKTNFQMDLSSIQSLDFNKELPQICLDTSDLLNGNPLKMWDEKIADNYSEG